MNASDMSVAESSRPRVLPSVIDGVTVFRVGARVRRVAELTELAELTGDADAAGVVRLENLPLSLDDGSVKIRLEARDAGPPPLVATDSRVELAVPTRDPEEEAETLDAAWRAAKQEVNRLKTGIHLLHRTAQRLESITAPPRPSGADGAPPPPSPAEARLKLLDFQGVELQRRQDELAALDEALLHARDELKEIEERRRRASNARQAREHELRKAVVVQLRRPSGVESSGVDCRLVLEYQVPGARWWPGYVARLDPNVAAADLAMRALVSQATGEDWSGVRLTLSTAEPQAWSELPELRSLRIGRRQPPPKATGWREPPDGAEALFADYKRALARAAEARDDAAESSGVLAELGEDPGTGRSEIPEGARRRARLDMGKGAQRRTAQGRGAEGVGEVADAEPPEEEVRLSRMAAAAPSPADMKRAAPIKTRSRSQSELPPPRKAMRRALAAPTPARGEESGAPVVAPDELLDYGRLRLAGLEHAKPGSLVSAPIHEDYLAILVEQRVDVRLDLRVVLGRAVHRAERAGDRTPKGYRPVGTWKGFDHAYASDGRVDIPADGDLHNIPLLERRAECSLRHVVVPRESAQAFRVLTLTNPLDAPLPFGPVEIYIGDDFLLTSKLNTVAPQADSELGLGVDEAVKVARNTHFKEQSTGIVRGRLELEHSVEIELRNPHPEPIRCEVRERLPVSGEDDDAVEVVVRKVEPAWQSFKQKSHPIGGSHRWTVDVEPGSTRRLELVYAVRIGSKQELVGGNRRES